MEKTKIEEVKHSELLKQKTTEAKTSKKKRPKAHQDKIRVGSIVRLIAGGKTTRNSDRPRWRKSYCEFRDFQNEG